MASPRVRGFLQWNACIFPCAFQRKSWNWNGWSTRTEYMYIYRIVCTRTRQNHDLLAPTIHVLNVLNSEMSVSGSTHRPQLSLYSRQRIRQLLSGGLSCSQVVEAMRKEGISTCRQTVWRLERHIKTYGTIEPLPKSGRITDSALMTIENAMSQDDETTAKELVTVLQTTGVSISKFTALKARRLLGWTSRGTAYCQSIRARNREKRLHWAQENLGAGFEDVIWSDETTVQMETHRRFCCRKIGQKP